MKRGRLCRGELILIIEDDKSLREGLAMNLSLQGYRTLTARDGQEGMAEAFRESPDLIVLDLMLPGVSGWEILSELKDLGVETPVLILSARDAIKDKIQGLGLGAEDYMTKPFELSELLARVDVILRRSRKQLESKVCFGELEVDKAARSAVVKGCEARLSAKEFDLLCMLADSPGRPFTREAILNKVWGWGFHGTTRTVDNFIVSLRRKIEEDPANPRYIKTVRQVGYKLEG